MVTLMEIEGPMLFPLHPPSLSVPTLSIFYAMHYSANSKTSSEQEKSTRCVFEVLWIKSKIRRCLSGGGELDN